MAVAVGPVAKSMVAQSIVAVVGLSGSLRLSQNLEKCSKEYRCLLKQMFSSHKSHRRCHHIHHRHPQPRGPRVPPPHLPHLPPHQTPRQIPLQPRGHLLRALPPHPPLPHRHSHLRHPPLQSLPPQTPPQLQGLQPQVLPPHLPRQTPPLHLHLPLLLPPLRFPPRHHRPQSPRQKSLLPHQQPGPPRHCQRLRRGCSERRRRCRSRRRAGGAGGISTSSWCRRGCCSCCRLAQDLIRTSYFSLLPC